MKHLHELDPGEATDLIREQSGSEIFYVSWERLNDDGSILNWDVLSIHKELLSAKIALLAVLMSDEREEHCNMSTDEFEAYIKSNMNDTNDVWSNGKDRYSVYSLTTTN